MATISGSTHAGGHFIPEEGYPLVQRCIKLAQLHCNSTNILGFHAHQAIL